MVFFLFIKRKNILRNVQLKEKKERASQEKNPLTPPEKKLRSFKALRHHYKYLRHACCLCSSNYRLKEAISVFFNETPIYFSGHDQINANLCAS